MAHTNGAREANLLGSLSLAVAARLQADSRTAALTALHTFMDGQPIEALSSVLGLSHSAAVRVVDRLEEAGLAARTAPVADGRAVGVRLTAAGHEHARGALGAREGRLAALLAPLSAAERRELTRLHEKLLAGVTDGHAAARHICRLCDPDACGHHEGRCPVTQAADAATAASAS